MDPTTTFTVPKNQTAAGSADIFSHLIENYFNVFRRHRRPRFCCRRINENSHQKLSYCIEYPDDYDARANLMWASTLALNGLTGSGKQGAWSCHPIEHELSAFYDITHGVGLAILTPRWMNYALNEETEEKFAQFARNVWGIQESVNHLAAKEGIQKTYDYFKACGIPMTLPEVGIDETKFSLMAEQAVKHSQIAKMLMFHWMNIAVDKNLRDCLTESIYLYIKKRFLRHSFFCL